MNSKLSGLLLAGGILLSGSALADTWYYKFVNVSGFNFVGSTAPIAGVTIPNNTSTGGGTYAFTTPLTPNTVTYGNLTNVPGTPQVPIACTFKSDGTAVNNHAIYIEYKNPTTGVGCTDQTYTLCCVGNTAVPPSSTTQ